MLASRGQASLDCERSACAAKPFVKGTTMFRSATEPSKFKVLSTSNAYSRRQFLCTAGVGGLAAGLGVFSLRAAAAEAASPWPIGVCGSMNQWSAFQKAGCSYVEEGVGRLLDPKLSDEEFQKTVASFKAKAVPVRACNGFLPGDLKLVGPETKHDEAVAYATKALERAKLLGIQIIVLGSGGARKVPDKFDPARAEEQFVQVVKRLGAAAEKQGVVIAMESLNRTETNFGNTLRGCLKLIKAVDHPNVKLVADMYHMLKEDESPESIVETGARLAHCHIAEKAQRTPPGSAGDDFKPYLRALKKIGYGGGISLECRWKNQAEEIGPAVAALKQQIATVAGES